MYMLKCAMPFKTVFRCQNDDLKSLSKIEKQITENYTQEELILFLHNKVTTCVNNSFNFQIILKENS